MSPGDCIFCRDSVSWLFALWASSFGFHREGAHSWIEVVGRNEEMMDSQAMKERLRLKDKVAIITGGARGIGRAFALGMADEGASLAVVDIDLEAAEATARDIQAEGREALAIKTDVSNVKSTQEMAKRTIERFGKIDILINNAGIVGGGKLTISRVPFYELDPDEWDRVIDVNLKGVFLCSRAVFPQMKAQGGGKIIHVSSGGFFFGQPNYVHYVASKGGVVGLTRAMAREVGDYNINVNCIAPGAVVSADPSDKEAFEQRVSRLSKVLVPRRAMKRMAYPEDIVGTAIFLASSDSDFVTGQTIVVDGGDIMH